MSNKIVNKLINELKKLNDNEAYVIGVDVSDGYTTEIGYFAKNGRGKYAIRLRYGITTLLKIRSQEEFENIKKIVELLEEKKELLEALNKLNNSSSNKVNKNKNVLKL